MNGATIIFDLDGTLVDTAPDLLHAANHVMARHGVAPVSAGVIRDGVGFGARKMIELALASHGERLSPERINAYVREFLAYYKENIAVDSRPFPGLDLALARLKERGARLGVCTNKPEALARRLLAELGLDVCFGATLGGDSLPVRKPHPGHLLAAIEAVGGQPGAAVMVGDSRVDVDAAKAAAVPVIVVGFGYSPEPADELGADRVIGAFDQLEAAALDLLAQDFQYGR